MKFRKKPIVIEAYQTKEERIITGIRGEQYPCKPDVFEKTYEPVN